MRTLLLVLLPSVALAQHALGPGTIAIPIPSASLVTATSPVTFYVDSTKGSDANPGTASSLPFATISKALASLPHIVSQPIIINLAAGTYLEQLNIQAVLQGNGSISIVGPAFVAYAPATGPQSGTFDSTFSQTYDFTASVSGATWTSNDLEGKFVQIGSTVYPIGGNTSNTLNFSSDCKGGHGNGLNAQGQAFSIVQPAATIKLPASPPNSNSLVYVNTLASRVAASSGIGVTLQNLYLDQTGVATATVLHAGGVLYLTNVAAVNNTSVGTYEGYNKDVTSTFNHAYLLGANNFFGTMTNNLVDVVFDHGTFANINCLQGASIQVGSGMGITCQGGSAAFSLNQLDSFLVFAPINIQSCPTGFTILSKVILNAATASGHIRVISPSSNGVKISSGTGRGLNALWLGDIEILSSGGDAIAVGSAFNHVDIPGATITGTTGYGVSLGLISKLGGHNQVTTSSATTMSSNSINDFFDGVNAFSLANLRADTNKTEVEATQFFNRFAEP